MGVTYGDGNQGGARSVVVGQNDAGDYTTVPVDEDSHLEVAIHSPRHPFGEIQAESYTPIFQSDGVYGINLGQNLVTVSLSGTTSAPDGLITVSTGETVAAFATVQSRKRLRYRPGQGVSARFTAMFPTTASSTILVAGIGTAEAGFYFGCTGSSYGILYSTGGKREIQTLTVQTGSTTAENVTISLNGVTFTASVTNNSSTTKTAYEISRGTFAGWSAEQQGSDVVFLASSARTMSGEFSVTASTMFGTFSRVLAGTPATDTWYPQASWNGDPLDGTGPSGFTLDPSKLNVHQIDVQYLGGGVIQFKTEVTAESNNAAWVTCHTLKFPGTLTKPNVSQPSFPFTLAAYSAGGTTDVSASCASYAGFITGKKRLSGNRFTYTADSTAVDATTYRALLTIRNDYVYNSRPNQSVVNLLAFAGAIKHINPVTLYLIRDASLSGTPNFQRNSTLSPVYVDSAATTCSFASNEQVIVSIPLGDTGNFVYSFPDDVTLQPGETLTLAAKAASGTPAYVTLSLNTREDQ